MQFFKKEWRTILVAVWLVIITVFVIRIDGHLSRLQEKNAKIDSTLGLVESVATATDSNIKQMTTKVSDMESNVAFIVEKIRRR